MTNLMRFDPFGSALSLRDAMNQLLEESFVNPSQMLRSGALNMPLDVRETEDRFVVDAVLPGVKAEDVDITIQESVLVINAETRSEQPANQQGAVHLAERRYGRFTRAISLPSQVNPDQVQATLENGVLHLEIPKAEQVKPRRITVNAGGTQNRPVDVTPQGQQSQNQAAQDQQDQVGS